MTVSFPCLSQSIAPNLFPGRMFCAGCSSPLLPCKPRGTWSEMGNPVLKGPQISSPYDSDEVLDEVLELKLASFGNLHCFSSCLLDTTRPCAPASRRDGVCLRTLKPCQKKRSRARRNKSELVAGKKYLEHHDYVVSPFPVGAVTVSDKTCPRVFCFGHIPNTAYHSQTQSKGPT